MNEWFSVEVARERNAEILAEAGDLDEVLRGLKDVCKQAGQAPLPRREARVTDD